MVPTTCEGDRLELARLLHPHAQKNGFAASFAIIPQFPNDKEDAPIT
jgi:hypothetical protein